MAQIKDTARVSQDDVVVPDITDESPAGIEATAKFVWRAVHARIDTVAARPMDRNGQPGYVWRGKVSGVIREVWPELSDSNLIERDTAKRIQLTINEYHRVSNTLYCLQRGRFQEPSMWWVSRHWTDYHVVRVTDAIEQNMEEEPNMTETEKATEFVCRNGNCDYESPYVQIRARHEQATHGFRIDKEGNRTEIPPGRPTDAEMIEVIVRVLDEATGPESDNYVHRHARVIDPRITRPMIKSKIRELADDPASDVIVHGTSEFYTYYTLASKVQKEKQTLVYTYLNETPDEPKADVGVPQKSSNGLLDEHIANLKLCLKDLETLNEMELELNSDLQGLLAAKDRENAELKAEVEELKAQLAKVTSDRDSATGQLAALRNYLNTGKM